MSQVLLITHKPKKISNDRISIQDCLMKLGSDQEDQF